MVVLYVSMISDCAGCDVLSDVLGVIFLYLFLCCFCVSLIFGVIWILCFFCWFVGFVLTVLILMCRLSVRSVRCVRGVWMNHIRSILANLSALSV